MMDSSRACGGQDQYDLNDGPRTPVTIPETPPSVLMSPRTPGSLEHSGKMSFPTRQRVIVAHLAMRLMKIASCPPEFEGYRMCVSWKWGSKECNRGTSDVFTITNNSALIVHNFQVVSSFVQQMPSKATEPNRMVLALQVVKPGNVRETLASRSIDMAQFSTDRSEKTKAFALDKGREPAMSLQLSVETNWISIDGKKVVDSGIVAGAPVDSLPLASPTVFPGVAPRSHAGRAAAVSPVVVHQAMKEGQRQKVLETAKTPNPTLEKMMESDRQLIRKASPVKAKESSPRKGKSELLSPPAHGSPFARRKEAGNAVSPAVSKTPQTAIFGYSLARAMEVQRDAHPNLTVPFVVHYLCCQVIALGGHKSEGIFRISINSEDLDTYSKNFDRGDYKLPQKDPNYPAVLLKHYLRNLPEPLCPNYNAGLEAAKDDTKIESLFGSLPIVTQNVLKYLANFICLLGSPKYVSETKMEIGALCIVFVPATLKNPVFDYASAIRNQSIEQAFMERLVLWLRARFPDDSVGGFAPPKKASLRPQRRAPATPVVAIPTPEQKLKKRGSTLSEEAVLLAGEGSPKTRKTGKNTSPASTQRAALSPKPQLGEK